MLDKFSHEDVNEMRRDALIQAGVIPVPEGYHIMPDGNVMSDADMMQDMDELKEIEEQPDGY